LRGRGGLVLMTKSIDDGRALYRRALDVRGRYPSLPPAQADWLNAQTEMHWALTELARRDCTEARARVTAGLAIAGRLPPGAGTESLMEQYRAVVAKAAECR